MWGYFEPISTKSQNGSKINPKYRKNASQPSFSAVLANGASDS
jgi:hypothetical protein